MSLRPTIDRALAEAPAPATGVLIIDLSALRSNYRTLKALAPSCRIAGVVKANGYGTGAAQAHAALREEGCDTFFVATLAEAEALRDAAPEPSTRIFVLDGLLPGTASLLAVKSLSPVLGSFAEVEEWAAFRAGHPLAPGAALHFDTGMTRLGLTADQAAAICDMPGLLDAIGLQFVMSHLACADDPAHPKNEFQRSAFESIARSFPAVPRSLANSAGLFLGQPYHWDLARPGIALYGGRPFNAGPNPMRPVVHLYGRVAQVRWAERGETVGYGGLQTLRRKTRIATVTAGYADGFKRSTSANDFRDGPAGYAGDFRLPLLGRVSMDLTTYDATDAPEGAVVRGGWVELLGERVTADDLAAFAGTIGYDVLTSLGRRYHRVYADA